MVIGLFANEVGVRIVGRARLLNVFLDTVFDFGTLTPCLFQIQISSVVAGQACACGE